MGQLHCLRVFYEGEVVVGMSGRSNLFFLFNNIMLFLVIFHQILGCGEIHTYFNCGLGDFHPIFENLMEEFFLFLELKRMIPRK